MVELPARADADEQPRRDGTTGDPDLAGTRLPPLVGDLAGRTELGIEHRAQRFELVVGVGRNALADTDDGVGLRQHVEIVVARAGENPDAVARPGATGWGMVPRP